MHKRITMLVALIAALALAMSSAAMAYDAFQGDDKSWVRPNTGNQVVGVADLECDGATAYGAYRSYNGSDGSVSDGNGCNSGNYYSGYYPSGIDWHKTCEQISLIPDPCGGTSFRGH